jgi:hypothetical protein
MKKWFSTFSLPGHMPLKEKWEHAFRDPGYLLTWGLIALLFLLLFLTGCSKKNVVTNWLEVPPPITSAAEHQERMNSDVGKYKDYKLSYEEYPIDF